MMEESVRLLLESARLLDECDQPLRAAQACREAASVYVDKDDVEDQQRVRPKESLSDANDRRCVNVW
jgi:hypothetical protein